MKFTLTKVENLKHAIQSIFAQIKNTTGKICVIVPDKLTLTIEKMMFRLLNIECSFDIEITTLTRFSQKIITELDINYTPISKLGSIILLKKILQENSGELKLFNSPSFSYKYSDELFKTLTQFKSSHISTNEMYAITPSHQLNNKIDDLRLISEKYEEQKCGLLDSCDRLDLVSLNISKSEDVKQTSFFFLGFDDFTTQGYILIEQLIKNAKSVNVAVYQTKNKNQHIYCADCFNHLTNLAYKLDFPLEIVENEYVGDSLHTYLNSNLLSLNKTQFTIDDEIKLFNLKDVAEEIEYVAKKIRQEIINGKSYKDFGVACYELENYATQIQSTFEKYDLNFYIDISSPLSNTIYYKFFINYLKLFANNFQLENLIQFINSDFLDINPLIKNKFNKMLMEIQFSGDIKKLKNTNFENEITYISNIFAKYKIDKNHTINEVRKVFNELSEFLSIDEKFEKMSNNITNSYAKKIMQQTKTSFDEMLDEISKFYPEIKTEELLDIVENIAKEQKINPVPQSIDCVQIIDASEILTDFDNLFTINCKNSTCPALKQDIGLILDKDIEYLDFKIKLSPTIAHLNKMAKFKAFNSFQMFNKTLTITMSIKGEFEKSEFVKDLQNRFFVTKFLNNETEIKNLSVDCPEFNPFILSYGELMENLDLIKDLQLENIHSVDYETYSKLNQTSINKINFDEISCSSLETYFSCPMKYFISNILNIKEARQQGIAMVDIGNMMHYLVYEYYKIFKRESLDLLSFCKNKLENYMKKDSKLSMFLNTTIHYNLIKEGVRFLSKVQYADENSMFVPTFFEYEFDSKFNKSIKLSDDVYLRGKIDRVDIYNDYFRIIDYKTGNANATLKELYYGKKLQLFLYPSAMKEILNKQLAGTFYFPIKNSINSDEEISPYKLTGFYLNDKDLALAFDKRIEQTKKSDIVNLSLDSKNQIKTNSKSNKVLMPNQLKKLTDYAISVSKNAITEIKQGNIKASPLVFDFQKNSCSTCPYISICRKNSMQIKQRTTKDINLSSFGGDNE